MEVNQVHRVGTRAALQGMPRTCLGWVGTAVIPFTSPVGFPLPMCGNCTFLVRVDCGWDALLVWEGLLSHFIFFRVFMCAAQYGAGCFLLLLLLLLFFRFWIPRS